MGGHTGRFVRTSAGASTVRLYPRLTRRFAHDEFTKQASLAVEELAELASSTHPLQVWPATGAPRASQDELLETRARLVAAAKDHAWPAPLGRDDQRDLDLAIACVLTEHSSLT